MKWIKRILCAHGAWTRGGPYTTRAIVAARLGMDCWTCRRCGKQITRHKGDAPVNYKVA